MADLELTRSRMARGWRCAALALGVVAMGLGAPAVAVVPYAEGPLLDLIRTMPEGSWQQASTNS